MPSKLNILSTADIHIYDYLTHSKLDEEGVPDRLTAFSRLAEDTLALARKRSCELIVVAGDVLHAATVRPMVKNYARSYLEILSSDPKIDVIVTHGQHDHDSKAQLNSQIHSGLKAIMPERSNLTYWHKPGVQTVKGIDILICPWQPKAIDFDELVDDLKSKGMDASQCLVFVGHGIVNGSSDCHGYIFNGGFGVEDLTKRFKLSIIGDVHHGQVLGEKNKVLVPGSPIQTNFKDDSVCGLWVASVSDDKRTHPTMKFYPIYDLRDDGSYHKFLFIKDIEQIPKEPEPHIHYRVKSSKKDESSSNSNGKVVESITSVDILKIADEAFHKTKPENAKIGSALLTAAYQTMKVDHTAIAPDQKLLWIDIKNFLSIANFYLDFTKYQGDILLIGKNGSGKTSFVEAIYYLLTGNLTKKSSVSDLSNWYTKKDASVVSRVQVQGSVYQIERNRGSGPLLRLAKVSNDELNYIDKSSAKETQELIYEILGVQADDILTLSYFSTDQLSMFGDLGPSGKMDLIGKLSGREELDAFRESMSTFYEKYSRESTKLEGVVSEISNQIQLKKNSLEALSNYDEEKIDRTPIDDKAKIYLKKDCSDLSVSELTDKLKTLKNSLDSKIDKELTKELTRINDKVSSLETLKSNQNVKREALAKEIESLKTKHKTASEGICPTCQQKLTSDDVLKEIKDNLVIKAKELGTVIDAIKKVDEDLKNLQPEIQTLNDKQQKNTKISTLIDQLSELLQDIETYVSMSSKDDKDKTIQMIKVDIDELFKREKEQNEKLEDLVKKELTSKILCQKILSRSGPVAVSMAKSACKSLEFELNHLISNPKLYKANVKVGKNIEISVSFKEKTLTKLSSMSKGERRLTDILMLIALNNLFSKKYHLSDGLFGLSIFDEVFTFLDDEYMEAVSLALQNSNARLRFIVSHDNRLQSEFDQQIRVINDNGVSHYELRIN